MTIQRLIGNQYGSKHNLLSFLVFFRYFSREPHFASSERNNDLAGDIAAKWRSYGFHQVEMAKYRVLMNFPYKDLKRNKVEIRRNHNEVVFKSQPVEKASVSCYKQYSVTSL